jgi:adenylyl-sulfate kinase
MQNNNENNNNFILWFTGLSGAGKTTLANKVFGELKNSGINVHNLDGDEVREASPRRLGFTPEDRDENIRLAVDLAGRYQNAGYSIVAGFISPYKHHRQLGREKLNNFVEIFVDTPLEVCEARDPKGLYQKARRGEIKYFTGIDDPYEFPESPDIHLKTNPCSIEQCLDRVWDHLKKRGFII